MPPDPTAPPTASPSRAQLQQLADSCRRRAATTGRAAAAPGAAGPLQATTSRQAAAPNNETPQQGQTLARTHTSACWLSTRKPPPRAMHAHSALTCTSQRQQLPATNTTLGVRQVTLLAAASLRRQRRNSRRVAATGVTPGNQECSSQCLGQQCMQKHANANSILVVTACTAHARSRARAFAATLQL